MGTIILSNIYKKFGDNILFENFSLKINKGEFISIMGESGTGKTTLLNIMGLIEQPDSGTVSICGENNSKFSSKSAINLRRYNISYLFQNYGLIDTETVEKNINLVIHFKKISKREKQKIIKDSLLQVGLQGYENRKVYTLSGGEQQRVALAKVIAKSPQIIFADEPTGSLDERNRDYVLEILKKLHSQGKTIVVVTHDPIVNKCAQRQIKLKSNNKFNLLYTTK